MFASMSDLNFITLTYLMWKLQWFVVNAYNDTINSGFMDVGIGCFMWVFVRIENGR